MHRTRLLAAVGVIIGLAMAAMPGLASALPASPASPARSASPASPVGPAGPASTVASAPAGLIAHHVRGCGPGVIVYTPRRPGTQPSAKALGIPGGPGSIPALARRWHARWMSTLSCESAPEGMRANPPRTTATSGSVNWSGYQSSSPGPNFATAAWRVPKVCCSFKGNDASVIWPGVGDAAVKHTALIQDGTAQYVSSRSKASYFFWFETFPRTGIKRIKSLVPRPGDEVMVSAAYATQTAGTAGYVLCDGRVHTCVNFGLKTMRPDGKVEWIAERPTVCRGGHEWYPPMADFVNPTLRITDGRYDINGSGSPIFPISHGHPVRIFMTDNQVRIATPQGLTSHGTAFKIIQNSPGKWIELKNKSGNPIKC